MARSGRTQAHVARYVYCRWLTCLGFLFSLLSFPAWSGTLETRCTTVLMGEIPVGVPVALRLPDGGYYSVRNASAHPLRVAFASLIPTFCERIAQQPRYEAMTHQNWVSVEPAQVIVPPGAEAEARVIVRVPGVAEFRGRHYEFWIQAQVLQGMGGVALLTRVRFDTETAHSVSTNAPQPDMRGMSVSPSSGDCTITHAASWVLEPARNPEVRLPLQPGMPRKSFWRRLVFW